MKYFCKESYNIIKLLSLACAFTLLGSVNAAPVFAANGSGNVEVTVEPSIKLDVSTPVVNVTNTPGNSHLKTGTFEANVTSNKAYKLFISTTDASVIAANLVNESNSSEYIASISASEPTSELTTTGWGIMCKSANCNNKNQDGGKYYGIATYNTDITKRGTLFYTSEGPEAQKTEFQVGVYVGSNVATGTYSAQILVTAAQI